MAERSEVSLHEVKVALVLQGQPNKWFTNRQVSVASGVAGRTARQYTLRLAKLGVIEQAQVFPGFRYRWSNETSRRSASYMQRLQAAIEAFGLKAA